MDSTKTKTDLTPWLAVAGLLLATVAVAAAIVALTRDSGTADNGSMPGMGGGSMSMGGDMAHMEPLSMKGIADPPSDDGGTPLRGTRASDGATEFRLDARPVRWRLYGTQRIDAYAYNGIVPGPQIRVRNGERVRVLFTNRLPVPTTVHWHGIAVPNAMDGVPGVTQKEIPPGGRFTYEFTARPAGDPAGGGTFLYHSHVDEDRQMSVGLAGALIIDPPTPSSRPAVDRTLVVSEWNANAETGRSSGVMPMDGMWPNFFSINGKSYPDTAPISVPAGRLVRLRLVNAGQFAHPLHLHGTAFRVVARDGHPTRDSGLRDAISLESGERADIEFRLPKGKWLFHCHIGHHLTNDGEGPGGLLTVVNAT